MNKNEKKDNKIITIEEAEADGKITVDEFNHLDKRTSAYKHLLENYKKIYVSDIDENKRISEIVDYEKLEAACSRCTSHLPAHILGYLVYLCSLMPQLRSPYIAWTALS